MKNIYAKDDTPKLRLCYISFALLISPINGFFFMHKTFMTAWPLFFGISMIMVGNGLQNTLLGVRATLEDFPTYSIGIIMSMYYAGFMLGSHLMPKLICGVGHIRVFAAMASAASATALFHGLFPDMEVWSIMRAVTGFSYAGLYIVIESWLNQAADNKTRGTMMAAYLVVLYASMAVGQYLLNLYDPMGMELFVLTSILVTTAVVPISLSSRPAPKFEAPVKVSPRQLFKTSPLGIYGVFASGMASACLFSIGPVYAAKAGFSLSEIASFMAAAIIGGVLLQFPIGRCSDVFDRRRVLIAMAAATALFCALAIFVAPVSVYALYLAMFLIGGTALPIYGLAAAHTNDHLASPQIVAASASMLMVNAVGSIIGPMLSSGLMTATGRPWMLFATMGAVYGSIAIFGLYRTLRAAPVPLGLQEKFVAQPSASSAMIMQQVAEQAGESLKPLDIK